MDTLVCAHQALGECMAARRGSPGRYVLSLERASWCMDFVQWPEGVGRLCSVCQHFNRKGGGKDVVKVARVRGGRWQPSGWY